MISEKKLHAANDLENPLGGAGSLTLQYTLNTTQIASEENPNILTNISLFFFVPTRKINERLICR